MNLSLHDEQREHVRRHQLENASRFGRWSESISRDRHKIVWLSMRTIKPSREASNRGLCGEGFYTFRRFSTGIKCHSIRESETRGWENNHKTSHSKWFYENLCKWWEKSLLAFELKLINRKIIRSSPNARSLVWCDVENVIVAIMKMKIVIT